MTTYNGARAAVVGGSIGGLTSALLLQRLGFDVQIFERTSTPLENRGGGIVLQPETMRWFDEESEQDVADLSTATTRLRYFDQDNRIVHDEPVHWSYISWGVIYRALLSDFGDQGYHLGQNFVGFDQDADGVDLRFTSGREERADLVVFADGITSTARRRIYPDLQRHYSGYVGWRGTVAETDLSAETVDLVGDSLNYTVGHDTHMVLYPIPGLDGSITPGNRLFNYVWYRNVAEGPELQELCTDMRGIECPVSIHPGQVQQRFVDRLRVEAGEMLAPSFAEAVRATEQPYLQVVFDTRIPNMAHGRAAVLGDAAFAPRPHAAAGSAKAAEDAWALHDHLAASTGDVASALKAWEPERLEAGNQLIDRVDAMGRRSQRDNTWDPADPSLRFGLRTPTAPVSPPEDTRVGHRVDR